MTADIKLLTMPEPMRVLGTRGKDAAEAWCRANVAHATAAKDAEIERLRAEVERWRVLCRERLDKTEWVQQTAKPRELGQHRADILRQRIEQAEARAGRLEEALRAERRWWVDRKADAIREQVGGLTRGDPGAIARCDAAIQRIDAALAQQPEAVDEAMVERIAALLHEEATDEPWGVAGVDHDGPDRDYYRALARKVIVSAGQQPASVDEESVVVPRWFMEKLAKDTRGIGMFEMSAAIRRVALAAQPGGSDNDR